MGGERPRNHRQRPVDRGKKQPFFHRPFIDRVLALCEVREVMEKA
jgi:hypothetical protein